ncbi:MAG: hypothetical protein ACRD8O_19160 [Bryobacteraceae bacterium]
MSKFILIDHSISSLAGHHYEYAVHVLQAAQQAGYTPCLATNRRFRDGAGAPWKIFPVYRYSFWTPHLSKSGGPLASLRAAWRRFVFGLKLRLQFSAPGVMWAQRGRLADFLLNQPVDRNHLIPLLPWVPLFVLYKTIRFLVLLLASPFALMFVLLRDAWRWLASREGLRRSAGFVFEDVGGLAALFRFALSHRGHAMSWLHQLRCLRQFTADTRVLFQQLGPLGPGDMVFLPTVSPIDMMGLRRFLERNQAGSQPSWHLLFRRDIYSGREGGYAAQDASTLASLSQVFAKFAARNGHRAFFYTDTGELTAQYDRLSVAPFHTLPIPHTHPPAERESTSGPLRVIYLGDARFEKGYPLLPHLIRDVWDDCVETGKAVFTLQSNYNIPRGEPEVVVARSHLESFPHSVELLKDPLTSEQYRDLLLAGDISLLLYEPEYYYARSSGILVESLAAGIPVIVPAATWLARQFLLEYLRHQECVREHMEVVSTVEDSKWKWQGRSSDGEIIAPHDRKLAAVVRVPAAACVALFSMHFGAGHAEVRLAIEWLDSQDVPIAGASAVLEAAPCTRQSAHLAVIPKGAARLAIGLQSLYASSSVLLRSVRLDFLLGDLPPLGAVGLAYHDKREIPGLLREMIDHYPHYRQTACRFAEKWKARHNAGRLVEELRSVASA